MLGQEDLLEKETATHSSFLAWEISWTEEPDGLQSIGHRVRHDLVSKPPPTLIPSTSERNCIWITFLCVWKKKKTSKKKRKEQLSVAVHICAN